MIDMSKVKAATANIILMLRRAPLIRFAHQPAWRLNLLRSFRLNYVNKSIDSNQFKI